MLEVSSPGLVRRIRNDEHLEMAISKEVEVHTFKPIENSKIIKGILNSFDDNTIEVDSLRIDKSNIASMKTVYNWED